jgi:arabinogalactan oligomer/maltooligosaccharide transport system permease protein
MKVGILPKTKSLKRQTRAANALIYTILSVMSVLWLLPIFYLLLTSFRAEKGAWLNGYVIPKGFTIDNYVRLFTDTSLFDYPRWFGNTLFVAIFSCLISTIFVLFTAYAFSRLRFKMRRPLMNVTLVLGMFPGFMSMIAIYHLLKIVGLDKTLAALILVYSGGAGLGYYITKGFFDTIPKSLDEAAKLDGASNWQIFWKITIPMSRPIITYTVLTSFMSPWLDFILASVIMKDNYQNYTIAVGLFRYVERENIFNYYTTFCAGAVIVSIPIAILFVLMQKNYVEGVTGGAVKG